MEEGGRIGNYGFLFAGTVNIYRDRGVLKCKKD